MFMKLLKYSTLLMIMLLFCFCKNSKIAHAKKNENKVITAHKPNIIFYLADDQDQLDYGCYGNPKVKTSNVDKLAKEGMRFTNFYTAQAICAPSRSQIFTGMYPIKNGCMANHIGVKPDIESVATLLQESGYEVVLAGKSHVKPNSVFNWTHYFENIDHRYLPLNAIESYLKNTKKPFCIFITSDYPHGPFPKSTKYTKEDIYKLPYDGKNISNHKLGYYKNIEDDNVQLGKVLKMVDDYGLRNNSMFIYASDHGLSGKWGLSEQGLKVPFIVRWPGQIKPQTTSNVLLSFVDVLPTFLDVLKIKIPDNIDGKSFYSVLKGNTTEINNYIYGVATKQNVRNGKVFPSRMVRGKRFKLIKNFNSKEVVSSNFGANETVNKFIKMGAEYYSKIPFEELYDLENDPYQKNNLAQNANYQKQKEILSKALKNWMITQNDFLITHKMPLLKPTLHPLDKNSKWTKVPANLEGKLTEADYLKLHY